MTTLHCYSGNFGCSEGYKLLAHPVGWVVDVRKQLPGFIINGVSTGLLRRSFVNDKEKKHGKSLSIFLELYFGTEKWQSVIYQEAWCLSIIQHNRNKQFPTGFCLVAPYFLLPFKHTGNINFCLFLVWWKGVTVHLRIKATHGKPV